MGKKGLDSAFLHYGIRREDMQIIEELCNEYGLDNEWVQEDILKEFHEKKTRTQEMDDKNVEKIIEKAIQKIK